MPGAEHLLFIPAVLALGVLLGYSLGLRAAHAEIERQKKRAKR